MKISIGNDHAGPDYKKAIVAMLKAKGYEVTNYVSEGKADFGIVICGSGNGIAMTVNKHPKVRAGLCWTKEIAYLTRLHNDANIVSIPARFTSIPQAVEIVETFLTTAFEGGRHQNRVNKIACS